MLKATSLASTITIMELTGVAKHLMSETFAVVEVFVMTALIYLAASTALIVLFRWWEQHLSVQSRSSFETSSERSAAKAAAAHSI